MNWNDAHEILKSLFDMPGPRYEKCKALFRHAQRTFDGCIVELGTAEGCGAIALALGAPKTTKVFTIDDFAVRKGWASEKYGPEFEERFTANCGKAGVDVTLVKQPVEIAYKEWFVPVGLLHWDLGMFSGMARDFSHWENKMVKGGIMLMHDTMDQRLGTKDLIGYATNSGNYRAPKHVGGGLWAFERRPNRIYCVGMSRSGGTLQYLITKSIVESAGIGKGVGFGTGAGGSHRGTLVMKVEEAKDWAVENVMAGRADAIGIFRDPRDVAASLMEFREAKEEFDGKPQQNWLNDTVSALKWQKTWEAIPGVYMARYESHRGDWGRMACDIGYHLGVSLSYEEGCAIADEWSIPRMAERIEEIKAHEELWLGKEWLLTRAHLGKHRGQAGRWERDLSREEARMVETLAGKEWMAAHGYRVLDSNG
jgi:hypothetical protein